MAAELVALLLLPLVARYLGWADDLYGVPLAVPWAGALGAVVQMANGLMIHSGVSWNDDYDYWYAIGPAMGAATGVVTFAIFAAGLASVGSGAASGQDWGFVVAAFITGANYRQFNRIIAKAGEGLFGTPSDKPQA